MIDIESLEGILQNTHEIGGISQLENELLDYRLKVLELEEKVRYLEAIENAARRYMRRVNDNRRTNKHNGFKNAKNDLDHALLVFETKQINTWEGLEIGVAV